MYKQVEGGTDLVSSDVDKNLVHIVVTDNDLLLKGTPIT